jgi:hypothetical protein
LLAAGRDRLEAVRAAVAWLNEQGVHAFVLEADAPTKDAFADAFRTIRSRSAEWQIKPDAVGVWASGAGDLQRSLDAGADFAVWIGGDEKTLSEARRKRVFVGREAEWKASLSGWLEQFKGKLF